VNPNANLVTGTAYTLTLTGTGAGGIQDAGGLHLATTTIHFTAGDSTAPTVTTTTPLNSSLNFALGGNVVVNFSERVIGVNGTTVVLRNLGTGTLIPGVVTQTPAGLRVTFNPNANLARNTLYQLTLTGGTGAITDASGNPLATTTVTFRTIP
jgi:Bacterial Ig-like domain